jgi:hypothetical protein
MPTLCVKKYGFQKEHGDPMREYRVPFPLEQISFSDDTLVP